MSRTDTSRDIYEATRLGLSSAPKELPPVWLYDERGSGLYEQITRLPDYYLPRREAEILRAHAEEIAQLTRARTLVELGPGNAANTRFLLDALDLDRYVAIDVSAERLHATARELASEYPGLAITEVAGDFERDLASLDGGDARLVALLGSTIGNLYPEQRRALLASLDAETILLGIDLVKDPERFEAAYNDAGGVTEAFVRNSLAAVNRGLLGTFEQHRFVYEARWDQQNEWVDIGLRAVSAHSVSIERLGLELAFEAGEWLRVEISSKFRRERFADELHRVDAWWTDGADDFAVVLGRS
ncbi:MAG TPA: L-histidine N(alpha)-methyltransferase [Gaiellaceae bacterium]